MGDLTRNQQSQPVYITDDDALQVAVSSTAPAGTEIALVVRNIVSGTQAVSGTVTNVPSGTQTVGGTVTIVPSGTQSTSNTQTITDNDAFTDGASKVFAAGYVFDEVAGTALTENDAAAARIDSKRAQVFVIEDESTRGRRAVVTASNALKIDGSAVTQPVSGTITNVPSGTQPVSGTVTNVPSGTQSVGGTITAIQANTTSSVVWDNTTTVGTSFTVPVTNYNNVLINFINSAVTGEVQVLASCDGGISYFNTRMYNHYYPGGLWSMTFGTDFSDEFTLPVVGYTHLYLSLTSTIDSGTTTIVANASQGEAFQRVYGAVVTTDGNGQAVATKTAAPSGTENAFVVRNIPSGTQSVSGTVNNIHSTHAISDSGTALTPKFGAFGVASSGNNTIVPLVSSKKIRVLAFMGIISAATSIYFTSNSGGTVIFGGSTNTINLVANGGFVLPFNPVGWFETAAGHDLVCNLSAANMFSGGVVYIEV